MLYGRSACVPLSKIVARRVATNLLLALVVVVVQAPAALLGPLRLIRARCKDPVQSVFADRVEDLVRKNERPAIHCRSALVAQERREVSAGIRSREGRSERNGSGVLVCDGRPHILGADILGAAEVPGSFSDH